MVGKVQRLVRRRQKPIQELAQEIDQHLRAIQQLLRRPIEQEVARSRLTRPQLAVLRAVVIANGISLKDLSREVSLAHSTVSGIVDRLERRGLVHRRAGAEDRRVTGVFMSSAVQSWVQNRLPLLQVSPLVSVLSRVKPAQVTGILAGVRTLRCALEENRRAGDRLQRGGQAVKEADDGDPNHPRG